LVVSIFGDESTVIRAIEAGAAGYLLKNGRPLEIGLALSDVMSGGAPISPAIARHLLDRFRRPAADAARDLEVATKAVGAADDAPNLTKREQEVLEWVSRGFTFAEIAEGLGLSHHTIGNHVRNIYRKLDVRDRAGAVGKAMRLGLIA
jgi:DNA-binding NarL/FixJ family response regulator